MFPGWPIRALLVLWGFYYSLLFRGILEGAGVAPKIICFSCFLYRISCFVSIGVSSCLFPFSIAFVAFRPTSDVWFPCSFCLLLFFFVSLVCVFVFYRPPDDFITFYRLLDCGRSDLGVRFACEGAPPFFCEYRILSPSANSIYKLQTRDNCYRGGDPPSRSNIRKACLSAQTGLLAHAEIRRFPRLWGVCGWG